MSHFVLGVGTPLIFGMIWSNVSLCCGGHNPWSVWFDSLSYFIVGGTIPLWYDRIQCPTSLYRSPSLFGMICSKVLILWGISITVSAWFDPLSHFVMGRGTILFWYDLDECLSVWWWCGAKSHFDMIWSMSNFFVGVNIPVWYALIQCPTLLWWRSPYPFDMILVTISSLYDLIHCPTSLGWASSLLGIIRSHVPLVGHFPVWYDLIQCPTLLGGAHNSCSAWFGPVS